MCILWCTVCVMPVVLTLYCRFAAAVPQSVMGIMYSSTNFLGMTNLMSAMPLIGYERVVSCLLVVGSRLVGGCWQLVWLVNQRAMWQDMGPHGCMLRLSRSTHLLHRLCTSLFYLSVFVLLSRMPGVLPRARGFDVQPVCLWDRDLSSGDPLPPAAGTFVLPAATAFVQPAAICSACCYCLLLLLCMYCLLLQPSYCLLLLFVDAELCCLMLSTVLPRTAATVLTNTLNPKP